MSFWRLISSQTVCENLLKYLMSAAFHSFNWFHLHLGHKVCQTEVKTNVINSSLKASSKAAKAWTTLQNTLLLPQARVGSKYMQCASLLNCCYTQWNSAAISVILLEVIGWYKLRLFRKHLLSTVSVCLPFAPDRQNRVRIRSIFTNSFPGKEKKPHRNNSTKAVLT